MAVEYPDYMAEVVEARQRYETDNVQHVVSLWPQTIAPGESAEFFFVLQNALNVPVDFQMKLELPKGKKSRPCELKVAEEILASLKEAEVAEFHVPIHCGPETVPEIYEIKAEFRALPKGHGQRIRPPKSDGRLGQTLLKSVVGLELASTVGVGFKTSPVKRLSFQLTVEGQPTKPGKVELTPRLNSLWTAERWDAQWKAMREVNERRIYIVPDLKPPTVYISMLSESRKIFSEAGIDLRLGEAIFLAKVLTYTVNYFLQREALQDALLTPIFQKALEIGFPCDNGVVLVVGVGYFRVVRLAIALSFGILEDVMKKRAWSLEEQIAVRDFIAKQLEEGQFLPIEFLYLPLLLGSVALAHEVVMEGEDLRESLEALAEAKEDRISEFPPDDEEIEKIFRLFDDLVQAQMNR